MVTSGSFLSQFSNSMIRFSSTFSLQYPKSCCTSCIVIPDPTSHKFHPDTCVFGGLVQGQRIGCIRVRCFDQNPERQLDQVLLDKVFTDKASGKDTKRPEKIPRGRNLKHCCRSSARVIPSLCTAWIVWPAIWTICAVWYKN